MTVQMLLKKANFDNAWDIIKDFYYLNNVYRKSPNENKLKLIQNNFYNFYDKLINLVPISELPNEIIVCIKYKDDLPEKDKNGDYIDGWVYDCCSYNIDEDKTYSLMFRSWNEIMSLPFCKKSIDESGCDTCAAHILYELSWNGFDEETVKQRYEEIENSLNEAQCDESEYISYEDLKAELETEYGFFDTRSEKEIEKDKQHTFEIAKENMVVFEQYKKYMNNERI